MTAWRYIAEQWLEANTIRCPVGRISHDDCERLMVRPRLQEIIGGLGGRPGDAPPLPRPEKCESCKGWNWIKKHGGAETPPLKKKESRMNDIITRDISTATAKVVSAPAGQTKTKHCNNCGRTLPITEFYESRTRRDGLRSQCKACEKARTARNRVKWLARQAKASPSSARPDQLPPQPAAVKPETLEPALVTLSPGLSPGAASDAQPSDRLSKRPLRSYAEAASKDEIFGKIKTLLDSIWAEAYEQGLKSGHRMALEKICMTLALEPGNGGAQ